MAGNGVLLRVKVVPGARQTAYCGLVGNVHKFRVAAPPEKGKANDALIDFLAKTLTIRKNQISLESGQTNPLKTLLIDGISAQDVAAKLQDAKAD